LATAARLLAMADAAMPLAATETIRLTSAVAGGERLCYAGPARATAKPKEEP